MKRILSILAAACLPLAAGIATTGSVSLVWDPTPPPDSERVAGYILHVGTEPGKFTATYDAGPEPKITVAGLPLGVTYYFAVTAYDEYRIESPLSDALAVPLGLPLPAPTRLRVVEIQVSSDLKQWKPLALVPIAESDMPLFVRAVATSVSK